MDGWMDGQKKWKKGKTKKNVKTKKKKGKQLLDGLDGLDEWMGWMDGWMDVLKIIVPRLHVPAVLFCEKDIS